MDVRDLQYLTAAANTGNFVRAARSLGISTSSITRRITRLENELGVTLFERSRTGIRLTAGGKAVLRHAHRVLGELDALKQAAADSGVGGVGEVRLGVWMPPLGKPIGSLLAAWREANPEVFLTVSEMNDRDIAAALEERRLDVALVPCHEARPGATTLPLYREWLWAALPVDHSHATREPLSWEDLRDEAILVQGWEDSQEAREFYALLLGKGARFRAHSASKQTILALVAAGFGITLVTASQAEIGFPGVTFSPINATDALVEMSLVWLPGLEDPTIGRFVAFLRDGVQS